MTEQETKKSAIWEWVKAICTVAVVGVICNKIYVTPITLTVDFPTLLSLLLALFSVGLAALFYFKATETSNNFYDNTNNFTKNIAQLLAKMESGFGEKLRNLDEGYSSMRDYLQNSGRSKKEIDETKEKIKDEKLEIEKVLEERNKIIADLLDRAQLEKEEKEKIVTELKQKESELESSQRELSKMNKRLFVDRIRNKDEMDLDSGFNNFTYRKIIKHLSPEMILSSSDTHLRRRVNEVLENLPRGYIVDLERRGYFVDGRLTDEGLSYIKLIAEMNA